MLQELTPGDEGKHLLTPSGEVVGVLARINAGTAYVRPTPGLVSAHGSWITGSLSDETEFRLDDAAVTRIGDDHVVIDGDTVAVVGTPGID